MHVGELLKIRDTLILLVINHLEKLADVELKSLLLRHPCISSQSYKLSDSSFKLVPLFDLGLSPPLEPQLLAHSREVFMVILNL